jgi:hypothetical protein
MRKKELPEYKDKDVINFYLTPHPIKITCKHFHISEKTLRKILNTNNVHIRRPGEHCRVYSYNEDFFYQQSADLGYILGLIASDGCIARNSNQIYIELQQSDVEILEAIRLTINLTRPVKKYTTSRGYDSAKIYIEDKKLKERLVTVFHLPSNKTYNHKEFLFPFDSLNHQYWKDYIRGYFDGDGSVKKTGSSLTFQIDGTNQQIIQDMQQIIFKELNILCNITVMNGINIPKYRIYAYGKKAKQIFEWFYDTESSLFLKRKKEKYIQLSMK